MLGLKIAREILKICTSKEQVIKRFLSVYGCEKAIRLIKKETVRIPDEEGNLHSDYKSTFSCDNCGELFARIASDKSDIKCPNCGHSIKVENYWGDMAYIDESYGEYSYVFSKGNRRLEPCTVLHEIVKYEGVDYHVMRRFHFS